MFMDICETKAIDDVNGMRLHVGSLVRAAPAKRKTEEKEEDARSSTPKT